MPVRRRGWIALATLAALAGTAHATLEDFYGDTGKRFRAAISFYNVEPIPSTISPNVIGGYGIGIDDMFISWKETRLDEDTTICAGECADVQVSSTLAYASGGSVEIRVIDKSPYDPVSPRNDCNANGSYADAADDQDCDDDGIPDVVARVSSPETGDAENAVLNRTAPASHVYLGRMTYSTFHDASGVLFARGTGSDAASIDVTYEDRDDGTGVRCRNTIAPPLQGFLRASVSVILTAGRIDYRSHAIALAPGTPGDDDGLADANETIDLSVRLANRTALDLDDVVVALQSSSPTVACVYVPVVAAGSVAAGAEFTLPPFRLKIAGPPTVARNDVGQTLRASFSLTVRSNRFDVTTRPIELSIDLDLNATGGGAVTPFVEDFEGTGLGLFTLQSLDAGKASIALSDGYRCQYNDPTGCTPTCCQATPCNDDCFLGFPNDPSGGVNDWHIQRFDGANCNSGRSFTGVQSLRWGTCPATATTPARDTTRFKQLDAVRTIDPINLPVASVGPELSFAHQVSLMDNRNIANVTVGEALDRGVVQVQLADAAGNPVGDWIKIQAYVNNYDQQGTDDFTNCTFDPIDDGNDEDDYFDPTDPLRRLGPSSTCYPEFSFARSGHTDWRLDFAPDNVGLAGDGPGFQGNPAAGFRNPGTWVRPKFNLDAFSGRRIRLRFLATSIELQTSQLWDELFAADNIVADDGWFIDDVRIEQAMSTPVSLSPDLASFTGTPCPSCTLADAVLTASPPPSLVAPGQVVTLDASASAFDACTTGVAQYQFWVDGNLNGIVGDAGDTLLHDWTDIAYAVDAPRATTRYGVRVRCSSAPTCEAAGTLDVSVSCPSTGNAKAAFGQVVHVDKTSLLPPEPDTSVVVGWAASASVDLVRGNLGALRASAGNYTGTVASCLANDIAATGVADGSNPGAGGATYFLVRPTSAPFCNQTPGYTTNHPREVAGRDAEIGADGNACP